MGKIIITLLYLLSLLAMAYGMLYKNNTIFVIGIAGIIAGYFIIRRKLKKAVEKE